MFPYYSEFETFIICLCVCVLNILIYFGRINYRLKCKVFARTVPSRLVHGICARTYYIKPLFSPPYQQPTASHLDRIQYTVYVRRIQRILYIIVNYNRARCIEICLRNGMKPPSIIDWGKRGTRVKCIVNLSSNGIWTLKVNESDSIKSSRKKIFILSLKSIRV